MADGTTYTPLTRGRVIARPAARLHGLDGIRGVAALFVVLHHCWLLSFPGYPSNTGPWWLGWLVYGHFAVVVFIVLSGFSLAIGPSRSGWQLRSVREFARRRAWRILPPYWAALAFSLAVAWWVVAQPDTHEPTAKSVAVYGFLVQDLFGSPSPNGAFWSIAIEAQLYILFPLLLFVRRTVERRRHARFDDGDRGDDRRRRAARCSCRHAHAVDAAVRRVVHGRHRRCRDPRRVRSCASASMALAGAHRGRPGRARDRSAGVGLDRRQLHLGRSGPRTGHGATARGGRRRQAEPPRTPARDAGHCSGSARAPTACTSRTHRSW